MYKIRHFCQISYFVEKWFSAHIIAWYKLNKRNLPWRNTKNPYFIWLSEIILQQTQVIQGLSYYNKFVKNYPTLKHLANANIDSVLKDWQGLGYYSRARNLHFTANTILKEYNGVFPKNYAQIKKLKGIGDYTAAAIASFAFNLPHAVVDGNVYRVLSRVFGIKTPIDTTDGQKEFKALAEILLDKNQNAEYNQAIMEFGSQICKPKNPDCLNCVLNYKCIAFANNDIINLPIKAKRINVKTRYFYYFVVMYKNEISFFKRNKKDIWQGLNEFYLIEKTENCNEENLFKELPFKNYNLIEQSNIIKHVLSHQHLYCKFYILNFKEKPINLNWIKIKNIQNLAWPRVIDKFINTCLINKFN